MSLGSENLKQRYEIEGYVVVHGVLDPDLIGEAEQHVHWLLKKHPELRGEQLHTSLVRHDPFWVRLVADHRLLDIAEQFVGPDIALFASHYICKPPRTGQPVLWHQDGSYWPLEPMQVVTLWLAISDSKPENGCMRVIPRTQHLELQTTQERRDLANVLGTSMDESLVDKSKAVDVVLKPGDVSVHHANLIHGSNANTSDRWRMGLTIRYIPTTTRILKPEVAAPFLLRGNAISGINEYLPKPEYVSGRHMPFSGCEGWA
jgi:ectoine hydroxylase-related dioxygenase (phytanoyl-CoA dioxygenase family)